MIIDCISDLHGHYPELEGGDLLIIAGDLMANDDASQQLEFLSWLQSSKYKKKIVIPGNHDNWLQEIKRPDPFLQWGIEYLRDSGTEFEGLKIWGSPWIKSFPDMNPKYKAFTVDTEEELAEKWKLIPDDTDILVTHGPPYGILDKISKRECVGSKTLQMELFARLKPKLFVCGHVHEGYGQEPSGGFLKKAVNASIVNELYQPVNKPIRIIL